MLKSQHSVSGARERSIHSAENEDGGGVVVEVGGGNEARIRAVGDERRCWILRRRGRECGRWGRRKGASVLRGVGWVWVFGRGGDMVGLV